MVHFQFIILQFLSEYLHQILQILNKYNYRVSLGNLQRLVSTKDCHFFLKFFFVIVVQGMTLLK